MNVTNWIAPSVDGREAMQLVERAFWQSRMVVNGRVPELPEIISPVEFLKESSNEAQYQ